LAPGEGQLTSDRRFASDAQGVLPPLARGAGQFRPPGVVGQFSTCPGKDRWFCFWCAFLPSPAPGVSHAPPFGDDPDPLSLVGSTDIGSAEHTPSRIEPAFGHFVEDGGKIASFVATEKPPDVFREDIRRFSFINDPHHVIEQPTARAFEPNALPCHRQVLAWKTPHHDVNLPAQIPRVKRGDVPVQYPFAYVFQHRAAVGVNFNRSHGVPP